MPVLRIAVMETKTGSGLRDGVSVMFADVSGFTAISERLDPEDVTNIVNRCFDSLESIVVVHGGVVLKYIGDCVMAAFGLDGDAEEGARHAAQASVDIREAVAAFNRQSQTPLPSPLQMLLQSAKFDHHMSKILKQLCHPISKYIGSLAINR